MVGVPAWLPGSTGPVLLIGDADGSYDFADLARFIEPLDKGGYDMVMGTRLRGRFCRERCRGRIAGLGIRFSLER